VDQTSGTNPTDRPAAQGSEEVPPAEAPAADQPGFRSRGRARRRARFLRQARELAYRDLGGLVYNLHRFGQRNDTLVLAKLSTLSRIDGELRTIETALAERQPVTVLREAGITACPRCAAIHGSEDRFCPNCGLPMTRHADLPITGAPAGAPAGDPPGAPAQAPAAQQPATAGTAQPFPQTATQAAVSQPAASAPPPSAQPLPAQQPAPAQPAFAGQSPVAAPGRAPVPPAGRPAQTGSIGQPGAGRPAGPEESTEIVRPPTPSS
jgi:hypothetical protein